MRTVALVLTGLIGALVAGPGQPDYENEAESWTPAPSCASGLSKVDSASDEFDEPLDGRWRVYDVANGDRSAELAYLPEMVEVSGGVLRLYVRADDPDDGVNGYPAGAVESTFDVIGASPGQASCVEVRTKGFAANVARPGTWDQNVFSAVWLHDRPSRYELNPNPEIDIQEFIQTDQVYSALHTWELDSADDETPTRTDPDRCHTGKPDTSPVGEGIDDCHSASLGLGDLTASQHTYGLRREIAVIDGEAAGLLTVYVDGIATWTRQFPADSPFVTDDRHVILSTQGNPPGDPGPPFPKVALHAWVRTYA
ncbi:hypothetical protein [Jiangella asiatica]|uniref:Glycosyl hydrolase family protein n=1 Tax=Jiangella asiatica TaxID=2530372 RepID=A0A4V2Z2R6_9ACTN|nr:hypothetical protein [Jiangella asiatica]TDE09858.1 hypothetical protein E1269_12825 [Jiangella asiatica]